MAEYVDQWDDVKEIEDLSDWSDWSPWVRVQAHYEWVEDPDFVSYDVIAFRDNVIVDQNAGRGRQKCKPKWVKVGERLVIAEVRKAGVVDSDFVYLVVIFCDGDRPIAPETRIKRRRSNVRRYGVQRWPRDGQASAVRVADPRRAPETPLNRTSEGKSIRASAPRGAPKGQLSRFAKQSDDTS